MPPLLVSQIKDLLVPLALECEADFSSGTEPFFKQLEWWLADGVFNHEPHGMFRTQDPYQGVADDRCIGEYLYQETHHRWEGMQTLMDLFVQKVLEMLDDWAFRRISTKLGTSPLSREEWEEVYSPEWEEVLRMINLDPRQSSSSWDEFLEMSLPIVIEPWRMYAEETARARARKTARTVSRHAIETAMIGRVKEMVSVCQALHPQWMEQELLRQVSQDLGRENVGQLEMGLYVHSSHFARRVPASDLPGFRQAYPIPDHWLEPLAAVGSNGTE